MPEKKTQDVQTSQNSKTWWVPLLIGIMMLFIPGGVYATPIFVILAIIMKRHKPKDKSPQNSPHSPLPLFLRICL